jgi:hypothetical protein
MKYIVLLCMAIVALSVCTEKQVLGFTIPLVPLIDGEVPTSETTAGTRAMDVTVDSKTDIIVRAMTIEGSFFSGTVGARIDIKDADDDADATGPLASADAVLSPSSEARTSVTVPIVARLKSGATYRVGFFFDDATIETVLRTDEAPIEPTGFLTIGSASFLGHPDAFPVDSVEHLPLISLEVAPVTLDPTFGVAPVSLGGGTPFGTTRGADVKVLGCCDVKVCGIELKSISFFSGGPILAAIYTSPDGDLLASASGTVAADTGSRADMDLDVTLEAGKTYRVVFSLEPGADMVGGTFDPGGLDDTGFPFINATGAVSIEGGFVSDDLADPFPTDPDSLMPDFDITLWKPAHFERDRDT